MIKAIITAYINYTNSALPEHGHRYDMNIYSDCFIIFAKMRDIINAKELNALFPNGAISFCVQLNRCNATALQLYKLVKSL